MRLIAWLVMLVSSCPVLAQEKPVSELEKLQADEVEARKAAAADPTIKNAASKPVVAYLIEQKRRRLTSIAGLQQRIKQFQGDKSQEKLIPVLKDQLAELERKPLEQVSFDAAYGYQPTTGLVGYSKKVRLIENTSDGKSVILVDNTALYQPQKLVARHYPDLRHLPRLHTIQPIGHGSWIFGVWRRVCVWLIIIRSSSYNGWSTRRRWPFKPSVCEWCCWPSKASQLPRLQLARG